uniref:Uncharacterized protein n=1 Tax=Arundo donax TaxID=35708 RepID=A0A0A9G1R0_ARUDO
MYICIIMKLVKATCYIMIFITTFV